MIYRHIEADVDPYSPCYSPDCSVDGVTEAERVAVLETERDRDADEVATVAAPPTPSLTTMMM